MKDYLIITKEKKSHLVFDVTAVAYSNGSTLRMMASEVDIDYINNAAILVENKPLSMSIYGWLRSTA
jgi:hypothetical protein